MHLIASIKFGCLILLMIVVFRLLDGWMYLLLPVHFKIGAKQGALLTWLGTSMAI
jgi:hypothetical protein